jgi:hypothetical protein
VASGDKVSNRIPEWKLQEGAVIALDAHLRANPGAFAYAAGLEGVRLRPTQRSAMRAQGMTAGEPDLRFYLPQGRLLLIELKAEGGSVSAEQKARHATLAALGFKVRVVKAKAVDECAAAVLALVLAECA